ncbi:MAG: hypothetical protein HYS27_12020 [Deltaproteobacteria bacterium]|nr:hypothetical protein [Deltaproteobacteria bacterium]
MSAAACPKAVDVPPPDGAALFGARAPALALLDAATKVNGSRLSLRARALHEQLAGCGAVAGSGADLEELLDALACAEGAPAWVAPARAQVPGGGVLVSFGDARGRLLADITAEADSVVALARFRELPARGPATLLVPAAKSAGPAVLSSRDALVHARLRVEGGIDIAAMAPQDSQGAQLFGLQAELLSSAVLSGTWELAMYAPDDGARVLPPLALALGINSRLAGERALAAFLDGLRQRWPVQPMQTTLAGTTATCIPNVRILPELAPCAVVLDDALVLGWNPHALTVALTADPRPRAPTDGVVAWLTRLPAADAALASARGARPLPVAIPWRTLAVTPMSDERGPGFRIMLGMPGDG